MATASFNLRSAAVLTAATGVGHMRAMCLPSWGHPGTRFASPQVLGSRHGSQCVKVPWPAFAIPRLKEPNWPQPETCWSHQTSQSQASAAGASSAFEAVPKIRFKPPQSFQLLEGTGANSLLMSSLSLFGILRSDAAAPRRAAVLTRYRQSTCMHRLHESGIEYEEMCLIPCAPSLFLSRTGHENSVASIG